MPIYEDRGVSGAKGREKRPQFDRMLRDAVRGRFDILAAWAVDRLGRSLQDLVSSLSELEGARVRAMFQLLGVFAEFERAMIRERIRAGLERARAAGRSLGRPRVEADEDGIREAVREGMSVRRAAERFGVSPGKVQRVLKAA